MRNPKLNTIRDTKQEQIILSIKRGMAHCLSHQDGILLFTYIMKQCNFQSPSVTVDPATGDPMTNAMVYCEARRNLWLELRRFIERDKLVHIELPELPLLEPPQPEQEDTPQEEDFKGWIPPQME